jgi:hypothetical protein
MNYINPAVQVGSILKISFSYRDFVVLGGKIYVIHVIHVINLYESKIKISPVIGVTIHPLHVRDQV